MVNAIARLETGYKSVYDDVPGQDASFQLEAVYTVFYTPEVPSPLGMGYFKYCFTNFEQFIFKKNQHFN